MKIRYGLVLSLATGFLFTACAGGASSGGAASPAAAIAGSGGTMLSQGERPRQSEQTRAAQRALEDADKTENDAAAQALYATALTAAEEAVTADPTNPLAHLQAGIAAIGTGDYASANAHLDRAEQLRPIYQLEIEPIRERAWINLYQEAAPLVNEAKYEEAIVIFENANSIYKRRPEVMITLGQIYAQLRQHDKAIENMDAAVAVINSDAAENMDSATIASWKEQEAEIPMMKASVLSDAGRYEEAVGLFEQLVQQHPDDLQLRRNLAAILVQTGDTERAFQVYDDLMQQPGLTAQDFYAIGVGFYQGSDYGRAAAAFKGASDRSVKDRDAIEMWTRSLQIDSAWADVPAAADRWIALDPNNQNAYLILAQAVNQAGNGDRASTLVKQIEALPASVNNLQLQRQAGGARVTGSVMNKTLAAGARVTLNFTFYDAQGNSMGTQAQPVTLGQKDMATTFEVTFSSTTRVGGYGYTLSTN